MGNGQISGLVVKVLTAFMALLIVGYLVWSAQQESSVTSEPAEADSAPSVITPIKNTNQQKKQMAETQAPDSLKKNDMGQRGRPIDATIPTPAKATQSTKKRPANADKEVRPRDHIFLHTSKSGAIRRPKMDLKPTKRPELLKPKTPSQSNSAGN